MEYMAKMHQFDESYATFAFEVEQLAFNFGFVSEQKHSAQRYDFKMSLIPLWE